MKKFFTLVMLSLLTAAVMSAGEPIPFSRDFVDAASTEGFTLLDVAGSTRTSFSFKDKNVMPFSTRPG